MGISNKSSAFITCHSATIQLSANIGIAITLDDLNIEDAIKDQRYEEAKNLIAKYIKSSRVSMYTKTVYQYYLGVIAYETKDIPEAIFHLKAALETGEKLPFAEDAKAKLDDTMHMINMSF